MATTTEPRRGVVRYTRPARLFHTAAYLVTLVLVGTGWWLASGREGRPSALAELLDTSDAEVHRRAGWALVALPAVAAGVLPGYRGVWRSMHRGGRVPASTHRRLWPGDPAGGRAIGPGGPAGGR